MPRDHRLVMSKKYKLDETDRKILEILAANGKISNIELAKEVGISPSPCLRRVKLLESNQYINGYHAEVNFGALGYELVFFISVNIQVQQETEKKEFEQALVAVKEILEVYTLNSGTDYLLKMVVKNY